MGEGGQREEEEKVGQGWKERKIKKEKRGRSSRRRRARERKKKRKRRMVGPTLMCWVLSGSALHAEVGANCRGLLTQ